MRGPGGGGGGGGGDGGGWGATFEAVNTDAHNLRGMLWPTVGFDFGGRPMIVFTARGENENVMPSGAEYGEGTYDSLHAATRPPEVLPGQPQPFELVGPIGGPSQARTRWPRMTIANIFPQPMAFVGTRIFKGVGADGYDGEVGITMKSIDSFFDPTDYWPSPTFLTNDNLLDWPD